MFIYKKSFRVHLATTACNIQFPHLLKIWFIFNIMTKKNCKGLNYKYQCFTLLIQIFERKCVIIAQHYNYFEMHL